MRYTTLVFLLFFSAVGMVEAQEPTRQEKKRYVAVPREIVFTAISHQPDCPLRFEALGVLLNLKAGDATAYQLRNRSTKPIRRFTIAYVDDNGLFVSWERIPDKPIMPGETLPCLDSDSHEVLPLTEQLQGKLELRGAMKVVRIYMIPRVEFADGSMYSDEAAVKALQDYFESK